MSANSSHAGFPPYTRGPYASMYVGRPWTIRQYAGFSTAEESNQFYKNNLAKGQKGLSVAFDLPTHRGYDSDHPLVTGDIGKAGVAIDSIEDMKRLFADLPLDQISVSMTMNGAVLPIMAFYIVAAEEQGANVSMLRGTIQNDILKEFLVRNTYIYPPQPSLRIIGDIMSYCQQYLPKFNPISVSGYHMHEAGATADIEVGFTLANGLEYINTGLKSGLSLDEFAPRMSFFWGIGMNFFTEISKMRAARKLWAELVAECSPKNPWSQRLRTHSQTSGWSLTAQSPINNIARTTLEAAAACFGGTQSLHTNAYDEAIALPSDHSAKIARDTQLFLQKQGKLTAAIDPWAGSKIMEAKTEQIYTEAKSLIREIQQMGGMVNAIESGFANLKIEQSAAQRQAEIDNGSYPIIGLNHLKSTSQPQPEVRSIDHHLVYREQLNRLKKLKSDRDDTRVAECLSNLADACQEPDKNLLTYTIEAAKARATLGEISLCLEKIYKRYTPKNHFVQQIYGHAMKHHHEFQQALVMCTAFEKKYGRRPRILVAKLGQDGHDRGSKIIASSFSDMGFDVDLSPLFQTPQSIAKIAVTNDVHFIGISTLAGGHLHFVPATISALKELGGSDIRIIVGGVIPEKDYSSLYQSGASFIFGPGSNIPQAAIQILTPWLND